MGDPDAYVMLMSSLPSSEKLFLAKQPPLSRLRLDERLRVLAEDDAHTLALVENALNWKAFPMTTTDREVIQRARKALAHVESKTLCSVIRERLELRTTVVALRRRARGDGPPASDELWGFGRWVNHITSNWTEPGFRLERVFPWVREAAKHIEQKDAIALERLVLERYYRILQRHAARHIFDFNAVVLYVLKWNIFDRWARAKPEVAAQRFDELTIAGLGDYESLAFEGGA